MHGPAISILIPTHNRRDPVLRLLRALEHQDPVPGGLEVIVVADGCDGRTAGAIRGAEWAFPITVVEQQARGPAVARNRGAALAAGRVLLFLDDDVEPERDVARTHAAFHAETADAIAVGDLPPRVHAQGFFGIILRGWWEGMSEGARHPAHRYCYRDLLSGHFSIGRTEFERLGGFASDLRCHEDYELGYRAVEAGMTIQFLPAAVAQHHEATNLSKAFRRKFDEGVADVRLLDRYPALGPELPLTRREGTRLTRMLVRLAWRAPAIGDWMAAGLRLAMRAYEAARLRFRWRAMLEHLLVYWYWRGVARESGSRGRFDALVARIPPTAAPEMILDVSGDLRAARARLDQIRPRSVRLVYGAEPLGDVPARAGAERLRGVHLPRLIVKDFSLQYLRAAAAAGAMPPGLQPPPLAHPGVVEPDRAPARTPALAL